MGQYWKPVTPHFYSIIADDRRSEVAAELLRAYRSLRAEGYGRTVARETTNALRISRTLEDARPLTTDGVEGGPGKGLRGRCVVMGGWLRPAALHAGIKVAGR